MNILRFVSAFLVLSICFFSTKAQLVHNEKELAQSELLKYGEVTFWFLLEDKTQLEKITRMVSIDKVREDTVWVYANKGQFEKFINQYPVGYKVLVKTPVALKKKSKLKTGGANEWDTYPTYAQYLGILADFQQAHPKHCRIDTIGYSINGLLILALKISNNVSYDDPSKPDFFYSSSMHGDELAGIMLMLHFSDYLLTNYGSNAQVNSIVNNLEIWINPIANPDGTYRDGEKIYIPTRSNSNGVDLNRNFPDPEDGQHPDGYNWQPENIAMMEFMGKHNFVMSANFHSGDEVVNYPWDTWQERHPDDTWMQLVAKDYADLVLANSPNGYFNTVSASGYVNGYDWYTISGGRQDYMCYYHHGREMTIELDKVKKTAEEDLPKIWEYHYRSLLNYATHCLWGISGTVKNIVTGLPVEVKIEIVSHDKKNSFIYSNAQSGNFIRLISEGSYTLEFSADSYYSETMNNIAVKNFETVSVPVQMVPTDAGIIAGIITDSLTGVTIPAKFEVWNDEFVSSVNNAVQSGEYKVYLYDGLYSIKVESKGYLPFEVKDVEISSQKKFVLDVALVPDGIVGVPESATANFVTYPNPSSGTFFVELPQGHEKIISLDLYNEIGQLVYQKEIKALKMQAKIEVDLGYLPKGVYFIFVNNNTQNCRGKIILE